MRRRGEGIKRGCLGGGGAGCRGAARSGWGGARGACRGGWLAGALRGGSGSGFRCRRRLLRGGWLSRACRCALRRCRRCGRIRGLLLCVCPGCFHRVFRRQEGLQSACRRRLQAEPLEHPEVRLIQSGAFTVFNDKAPALFLNVYPYRIHTVKHASNPPLDRRALHTVRETAFDLLNIRVLGTVPFYDPLFAVLKIDRNSA